MNKFKDRFDLVVIGTLGLHLILIGIFVVLNLTSKPHIRFFEINGEVESADFTNQRIKVYFNSPMDKINTSEYLSIQPETRFRTAWSNNSLFIIFEQNLLSETEYKITFSSDFKDLYNEPIQTKEIQFKTKKLEFLYTKISDGLERIVRSDMNFNTTEVFSHPYISTYDAGGDYMAVVTENDNKTNEIHIVNLDTLKSDALQIDNKFITSLAFSPLYNEFAYVEQLVSLQSSYVLPLESTSIVIYNIDTFEEKRIEFNQPGEGVTSVKFSPDGNSLLYKTSQSYYQIVNLNDESSTTILGRYFGDGGFNFDGSKIAFIEFDQLQQSATTQYIVELNVDRESETITDGKTPVLDPEYFNTKSGLVYAQKYEEIPMTKGKHQIVQYIDGQVNLIVSDEILSLELPKISFDDRFMLIEGYKETDLLSFTNVRNFGFQTKPESSDLLFYDFNQQKLINIGVRGYDAIWLR